jgi:hypothetical protein
MNQPPSEGEPRSFEASQVNQPLRKSVPELPEVSLEERFKALEASYARAYGFAKWALGSLTTIALTFAGVNWLTARINVEQDKDALKQHTDVLSKKLDTSEQELLLADKKREDALRNENQSAILNLSNQIQQRFVLLQKENAEVLSNSFDKLANIVSQLSSNAAETLGSQITDLNRELSNAIGGMRSEFQNAKLDLRNAVSRVKGNAMMTQAELKYTTYKAAADPKQQLHQAAVDYLRAARLTLNGGDSTNFTRCIIDLNRLILPRVVASISRAEIVRLEASSEPIQAELNYLIFDLQKADDPAGYLRATRDILIYWQKVVQGDVTDDPHRRPLD